MAEQLQAPDLPQRLNGLGTNVFQTCSWQVLTEQMAEHPGATTPWPKTLQAQIRSVRDQLSTTPMDTQTLASHYKRKPEKSVTQVLEALTELGMVRQDDTGQYRLRET